MSESKTGSNQHTRRASLKDEFFQVHKLLLRNVSRLSRTLEDYRWPRYAGDLADVYLADVGRMKAVIDRVYEELLKAHIESGRSAVPAVPARGERGPDVADNQITGDDVNTQVDEGTHR